MDSVSGAPRLAVFFTLKIKEHKKLSNTVIE